LFFKKENKGDSREAAGRQQGGSREASKTFFMREAYFPSCLK